VSVHESESDTSAACTQHQRSRIALLQMQQTRGAAATGSFLSRVCPFSSQSPTLGVENFAVTVLDDDLIRVPTSRVSFSAALAPRLPNLQLASECARVMLTAAAWPPRAAKQVD
jgi:hypothetical protein